MARNYVDTSGITTQQKLERTLFVETPPSVDLVIDSLVPDSGATDGVIAVSGTTPDGSASSYQYDLDGALTWANTTGEFTGLAAGVHTVQGRDAVTTANVSIVISLTV